MSESLSELDTDLQLTTTEEAISVNGDNGADDKGAVGEAGALLPMFGKGEEAVGDSGATSFTCVKDEEAVGDAGALVATGVLADGAADLKRRATMSDYGRKTDSSVRC